MVETIAFVDIYHRTIPGFLNGVNWLAYPSRVRAIRGPQDGAEVWGPGVVQHLPEEARGFAGSSHRRRGHGADSLHPAVAVHGLAGGASEREEGAGVGEGLGAPFGVYC